MRMAKVAALLFFSGVCALIYQTVWMREIRLIFGASTSASAAVLFIFMGGLGLGGWLLGRRAERHPNPLAFYATLELAISASAALTPFLIRGVRLLYVATGGSQTLGMAGATVARLLLSTLVLGFTTVAMGGTLPAVARAVERAEDVSRRGVAVLFGVNTLGAVLGVALSTFFLLEALGNRNTLWFACGVNALVGLFARALSRKEAPPPASAAEDEKVAPAAPARFVLVAATCVGFAFMLMEMVWYRSLAPILGGSTYTFGLVLLMALLGIGLGGAAYALWGRERRATLLGLAFTCALEGLLVALPLVAGDRVAVTAALLRNLDWFGFTGLVGAWGLISLFVVFPGAVVSGYQFPLLIALLGRGDRQVGRQVGLAYAWNTIGSILGALAGGFGLMPLLTAVGTWRLAAVSLALLGLAAAALFARRAGRGLAAAAPAALALAALGASAARGPTPFWRHTPIGAGRAAPAGAPTLNRLHEWENTPRLYTLWERDGVESTVGMLVSNGISFVVNGKSDGNAFGDSGTQVMGGLIGAVLHDDPKRALVIGLGTGSTAGWLAQVPSMERVDVAEIEPAILEVAKACAPVNRDVLANPKVKVFLGDAREFLLTSKQPYDIIFSEPSNPYRSGITSLYTREYYQVAKSRLGERGIFLQWLQAYEVQPSTVRTVLATIGSVFPQAEVWQTTTGDLVIAASASPIPHDVGRIRARLAAEPYASAMRGAWEADDAEGFFAHFLAGAPLVHGIAETFPNEVNTDDANDIEFAFARSVGRATGTSIDQLTDAAARSGALRPTLAGELDWQVVEEDRRLAVRITRAEPLSLTGESAKRYAFFTRGGPPKARLEQYRQEPFEPKGARETMLLAQLFAEVGDDGAEPFIERLRAGFPVDALSLTAQLRYAQGKVPEAGEALLEAFAAKRTHVWSDWNIFGNALGTLSQRLAHKDAQLARRFYAALEQPFPAYDQEALRRQVRLSLANTIDFAGLCAEALGAFEPYPPWDGDFLARRVRCYRASHAPALAGAEGDWRDFLDHEQTTLLGEEPELAPTPPSVHAPTGERPADGPPPAVDPPDASALAPEPPPSSAPSPAAPTPSVPRPAAPSPAAPSPAAPSPAAPSPSASPPAAPSPAAPSPSASPP